MKEHPILFSAPMVRALLAGTKTQTRRICKCVCNTPHIDRLLGEWSLSEPPYQWDGDEYPWNWRGNGSPKKGDWIEEFQTDVDDHASLPVRCPYGAPGDRLWVKETFRAFGSFSKYGTGRAEYRATEPAINGPWKPSIFMPRWASRITLEIENVRVERLNDISASDCFAEGIERPRQPTFGSEVCIRDNARNDYQTLWESINGKGSWALNPWVWVVQFKKL